MHNVLIVEDDRPMARALELKLTEAGLACITASNGKEALERLDGSDVDIIILDILMPKMNGLKFLEELAKKNLSIPVIVTSNLSHDDDIKEAKRLGAVDYFIKAEITLNQIVDKIQEVLGASTKQA